MKTRILLAVLVAVVVVAAAAVCAGMWEGPGVRLAGWTWDESTATLAAGEHGGAWGSR